MKPLRSAHAYPYWFVSGLLALFIWQCQANVVEVDWNSNGFYKSQITINAGDEVDIVNLDDTFDLLVQGAPPEAFSADIPPTDGYNVYYVPYVYSTPGTYSFSDEFGGSVTVTVNSLIQPLSVTITAPTNNATFIPPATFDVTAEPTGGTMPYTGVQFFVGTNLVGVASNSSFTTTITNLPVGSYNISAIVTDSAFDTASNSILVNVNTLLVTNTILPVACNDIYSSGSVNSGYLGVGPNPHGGLEFAAFNANPYTSILLELNPYGLPLFGPVVDVYGFDGGNGTLMSSNFNSGTLIGEWTLPTNLDYGQVAAFDVTAFVKSTKGPYFGFILVASGSDVFSSTTINYGTPPALYAISPPLPPLLSAVQAGNQIVLTWSTNNADGLSLQTSTTFGVDASWNALGLLPALVGNQWVVTNPISGPAQFFRLSNK